MIQNKIRNPIKILDESETVINSIKVKALPTSYPYYHSTFSILFEDEDGNSIFHEGHRVNFKYLETNEINADVSILTAEESKSLVYSIRHELQEYTESNRHTSI